MVQKLGVVLIILFLTSCSGSSEDHEVLDLSSLDLTDVNFGFDTVKDIEIPINFLKQGVIEKFSSELIDEIDKVIKDEIDAYVSLKMTFDKQAGKIYITHAVKHYTSYSKDTYEANFVVFCANGKTNYRNYTSAEQVKKRVAELLKEIRLAGKCENIEVSKGHFNATICSQSC